MLKKDILVLNYFEFVKYLYFFVPFFRMLEDDLKLSSDEEDNEQVRFSYMLLSFECDTAPLPSGLSWELTESYTLEIVVL